MCTVCTSSVTTQKCVICNVYSAPVRTLQVDSVWNEICNVLCVIYICEIQLLESPFPTTTPNTPTTTTPTPTTSQKSHKNVTKSVKWRYLGNQAWYHRSAGVKTTRKILNEKIKRKNGKNGQNWSKLSKWSKWSKMVPNGPK